MFETYSIHEREDLISSEMVSEIGQLDGIERVFSGTKTIQEVVTEEIIFAGKQTVNFDPKDSSMV